MIDYRMMEMKGRNMGDGRWEIWAMIGNLYIFCIVEYVLNLIDVDV